MLSDYVKGNSLVQLVNIDQGFIQQDETISHHHMYNYLHLTNKGYQQAFEPVNDLLLQILQEMEGDAVRPEAEGSAD